MRQRSGQLIAPTLGAVLVAGSVGLAFGLRHKPASAPFVVKDETAAVAGAVNRERAVPSVASRRQPTATIRPDPPFEVKCRIGLASCRKWVALQERKGLLLVHNARR